MHRLLIFLFLTSCATGSKHLVAIDLALTDIQNGKSQQGRDALEKLCDDGSTGACALSGRKVALLKPISILQSVTSNNQSRFVAVVPHREKLKYFMRNGDALTRLDAEHFEHAGSANVVDQVEAFGLEPKVSYELIVISPDGMLWDKRVFRALDLNRKRARIAVASGMDDALQPEQTKLWNQLANQRPDVIFMIGDNVYTEKGESFTADANPESIWKRYAETRENLAIFKVPTLIPVMAVWNDHDYGRNDGDRTYPYKTESADIFLTFFAQKKPAPGFERGPGVSSWWNAFGIHFAFMDSRSFRSPNGLDIPDQTHFGVDQEKWLSEHLLAAHEPVFLISGDQFFGASQPFESYERSHPKRFFTQLEEWKKDPEPLLFLSGDRHLSEIAKVPAPRLGYPTYELTSSGMHSAVSPGVFQKNPEPNQLVGADGQHNYMMVEVIRSQHGFIQLDAQAFGLDRKQLYQRALTVKH